MFSTLFWKDRLRASGIHLAISLGMAALAAMLVFAVWYPYPYREISGGRELFLIVVTVDVILGPLITLTVFNRAKPKVKLRRDLVVVVLVQLAALAYGLWTVAVARPVHLVFEYDRFRVVHAVDVPPELMGRLPPEVEAFPLRGPTLLALRPFHDGNEQAQATLAALEGVQLSSRPDLWQPYPLARQRVLDVAKPVVSLKQRFADHAGEIDVAAARIGRQSETLVYLPMVGRKAAWTVFLDSSSAEVLTFMPLDSF
ncbi:MAG: pilus assembly protein [Curvibacter sp. PD_MW3]|nr:MAG: pilus assembly protein [Curvibacter sp. PD_MW3]